MSLLDYFYLTFVVRKNSGRFLAPKASVLKLNYFLERGRLWESMNSVYAEDDTQYYVDNSETMS